MKAEAVSAPTPRGRLFPGGVALLGVTLFAGVLLACELLCRVDAIGSRLPPPSIGCGNQQLDLKLVQLGKLAAKQGRIDCLIFGNSMVFRDLDPVQIVAAYRQQTGRSFVCFNFGIMGLSEPAAAPLASLLLDKYQPGLVIFGTSSVSMDEDVGKSLTKRIRSNPWIRYHQGHFSLDGWLIEHSEAYRRYIGYRYLDQQRSEVRKKKIEDKRRRLELASTETGFKKTDIIREASMAETGEEIFQPDSRVLNKIQKYHIDDNHLSAYQEILQFQRRVPVLILQMPYHPYLLECLPQSKNNYKEVAD